MEEQIANFGNKGMYQDVSISKSSNEFAFENINIRITANEDNTLLSVTNEKGPISTGVTLRGVYLGKCLFSDKVIIFSKDTDRDYINKVYINNGVLTSSPLFSGNLNFNLNNPIEAICYYESDLVQKVYWVDGLNVTRVINVEDNAVSSTDTVYTGYDFNPEIASLPTILVEKDYNGKGIFPAGTIQYYVSYYNKYGPGTPIVAASGINYLTKVDRGAKADEVCTCSFKLTISDLDINKFNYIKVYSVIRTSLNGPKEVKVVGDFKIPSDRVLTVVDTNINEEVLSDTDIYYLGGQYFVASTLDQKDNTAFFGDITIGNGIDTEAIKEITDTWYNSITKLHTANKLRFTYKTVGTTNLEGIYTWDSELNNSGNEIQGFKNRELYRFAIQFMTKTGEWTQAFFIGDLVCDKAPTKIDNVYNVPCVEFSFGETPEVFNTFLAYRLLAAEAGYNNRRILAQGVLCPTVFNFNERAKNHVFSAASWNMRPRGISNEIESRHYVPIINEIQNSNFESQVEANLKGFVPYTSVTPDERVLIIITAGSGHYINVTFFKCTYNNGAYTLIPNTRRFVSISHSGNWNTQIAKLETAAINYDINVVDNLFPTKSWIKKLVDTANPSSLEPNNGFQFVYKGSKNHGNTYTIANLSANISPSSEMITESGYSHVAYRIIDTSIAGSSNGIQNRAYFPDEQILSFHTPEVDNISDIIDGTNCKLDIVGIVPLTANFGDFSLTTEARGFSTSSSYISGNKFTSENISSVINPIVSPYLWGDYGWKDTGEIDLDKFDIYRVFLWHSKSSLSGYTPINSQIDKDEYPVAPAELKHKVFGNLYFSNNTEFLDTPLTYEDIIPAVYQDDETLSSFKWENKYKIYSGQLDTMVASSGKLDDCFAPDARIETIDGAKDTTFFDEDGNVRDNFKFYDPVRIKYRCTPHIVLSLNNNEILPKLEGEETSDEDWDLYKIFTEEEATGGEDAYMYNYPWYISSNEVTPDFKFAGAYYLHHSATTDDLKNAMLNRGKAVLADGVTYYVNKLFLPDNVDLSTIYLYKENNTYYAICKDSSHEEIDFTYKVRDIFDPYEVHTIHVNIDAGLTTPVDTQPGIAVEYYGEISDPRVVKLPDGQFPPNLSSTVDDIYAVVKTGDNYTFTLVNNIIEAGVQLNKAQDIINVGGVTQLAATVYPESLVDKSVTWSSSNSSIARVDSNGLVTGVSAGNATIKATANNGRSATCSIYVTSSGGSTFERVVFNTKDVVVKNNEWATIEATVLSAGAPVILDVNLGIASPVQRYTVEHSEGSNKWYIKIQGFTKDPFLVDTDGQFAVNVYHKDDINKENKLAKYTISVKIPAKYPGMKFRFNNSERYYMSATLNVGESLLLTPTYSPYSASDIEEDLVWKYFNTDGKVVIQNQGNSKLITAIAPTGSSNATIRAYLDNLNGPEADCHIKINVAAGGTEGVGFEDLNSAPPMLASLNSAEAPNLDDNLLTELTIPAGVFTVDTGVYEYYTLNDKPTPQFMKYLGSPSKQVEETNVPSILKVGFTQRVINADCYNPYLFLGELYRDATGDELYGTSLENLTWNPISNITPISRTISTTYGDTFYQRWDCLKSYPMTEEDVNSVVDITSFMVESHRNLDARSDTNRGIASVLRARPTNYNLFNTVYDQVDNIFQYNVLDDKFSLSKFSNQIVWSLPKTPMDDIDTWTQTNLINSISLNGTYGPITKIINTGDTILAFQDSAIARVNYNDRTMLSSETNVPVQIANSNKVDGYMYITTVNGCRNKWSISKCSSGIYFIDDNISALYSFNKEGIRDISTSCGFSIWFKDNLNGLIWDPTNNGFIVNYDYITKDLYISNKNVCLVFNELLGSFTSFMAYNDKPLLFNLNNNSYIVSPENTSIYKMFEGDYNKTFDNSFIDYSIRYRVNPEPLIDKTFTNIEYIADITESYNKVDNPSNLTPSYPFDKLEAWNEYQYGSSDLHYNFYPSNLKKKFRIWRADIPRDENSRYKMDRIRNPWINLRLSKNVDNTNKFIFHNLAIKYFK